MRDENKGRMEYFPCLDEEKMREERKNEEEK